MNRQTNELRNIVAFIETNNYDKKFNLFAAEINSHQYEYNTK